MPIEWKNETVNDHSGGITDLVTDSSSQFQELCENLGHNVKLQLLSSREGYRRFTEAFAPSPIVQLFKLEDWIIAALENGHVYYRLESDTVSAWTQVDTPKARTATILRVYDSFGKGVTLRSTTGAFDQLVVKAGNNAGTTPDATFTDRTLSLTVQTSDLNADKTYITGSGNLEWSWFQSATFTAHFTVSLLSGTLATDDIHFDGMLTVEEEASSLGIYPASIRSDGDGSALTFAGEDGHLQASDWQAHLYFALEPYSKVFTANASDPYGADPDTYPPTNGRLPLRKIAPLQPLTGSGSSAVSLKAMNAQLPKVHIGVNTHESVPGSAYSNTIKDYRYQVYRLRWNYKSGAYAADESAWIEIWSERTWGQVGSLGQMTDKQYLIYEKLSGTKNLVDDSVPFALVDYDLFAAGAPVAPYNSVVSGAMVWGDLVLAFHEWDAAGVPFDDTLTFTEAVEGVQAAFQEYQTRKANIGSADRYAGYRNFGFYIRVSPTAKMSEQVDVGTGYMDEHYYADTLPEDVPGNHTYGVGAYLRTSYQAAFEGAPREFLFDGPAAFQSVRTLSPIGSEPIVAYREAARTNAHTFSAAPAVYAGISASISRATDLHYQSQMEMVFARTLDGGDTYFIDELSKYWWRTADVTATLPAALIDDDWAVKTFYVAPYQSRSTDDELQLEAQAYFNGGVLSFDSLPQGPYYFHVINQKGYAANIVGNIQRVYESVPGVPHALALTVFEDFDDEVTGISSFADKPIVTTDKTILRIEGSKTADGSGRTFLRTVSDEYGCISNQSIVQTNVGIFLWSNSGIIYTDGLKALRVSEHLIERYETWLTSVRGGLPTIGPEQLRGSYDALNRKVYWSLKDENGKPFFVVLSLQKGISPMMPIVTESGIRFNSVDENDGEVTPVDYFQTHATLYSKDMKAWYRGQGTFLMVRDSARTYDESHIDDLKHPILPYFKSTAFAFQLPWATKQTSKIHFNLRDLTRNGVSLTPLGWNDLSTGPHKLGNCLNFQHMDFALDYSTPSLLDLEHFFRHTDAKWKTTSVVTYKRRFGKGKQRNLYKQVGFQALKLRYDVIDKNDPGITLIELTHKAVDGTDFAQETVFIDITQSSGTAIQDLELDASGQFYVSWNDTMEPAPISDVELLSNSLRIIVLPSGSAPINASDYTEKWPALSFYRVFTDQKIDMLGYKLDYRLIGDRTTGNAKSTDNGGVDA
ncbi:MAG TPA: hypothetical protein VE954_43090 [Oligoflexus sp.]|uniref:hypothetical protein n=1 Tax=Oligoflexus sp. TaxID=1971216 RepID=UPI002D5AAA46|nr:hypothetical protein [Oligoflexus sp.]HYX39930.1 hypothetical protein [Oligoflexus sp.]